ncbi:unnamed protein product, partial [Urochloa humidicola]
GGGGGGSRAKVCGGSGMAEGRSASTAMGSDEGTATGSGGGTSSPTSEMPSSVGMTTAATTSPAVPPPQPTVPLWPGYGGSGGHISSPQPANPWFGYLNMLQQPHVAMPQSVGENSHFVGFAKNWNPPSPPAPAPYANGTPTQKVCIDIDTDDGAEASKSVKKRYWSHDEEVRLASAWLNISKNPVHGNCKKIDSFWGQITEEFNKNTHPDLSRRRSTGHS